MLTHVGGMEIPDDWTLRQMVDAFKTDKGAQQKLRDFMVKNPMTGYELPDGTIQISNAHHRTFFLDQAGDKTVPAIIKDNTGPSK